jgi:hypothetical protein
MARQQIAVAARGSESWRRQGILRNPAVPVRAVPAPWPAPGPACGCARPACEEGHLVLDERAVGVGVAALALALRAPVLLAVALAALTTALVRAFG